MFYLHQVPNLLNTTLGPTDVGTAKRIDDYFRQELIYRRNERMAQRVSQLIDQNPNNSFFFAFGAGKFQCFFIGCGKASVMCSGWLLFFSRFMMAFVFQHVEDFMERD